MKITSNIRHEKAELLTYFRTKVNTKIAELNKEFAAVDYKMKAAEINKFLTAERDALISQVEVRSKMENWPTKTLLESILMINYTNFVVMLESRNQVWAYDYMAFSRRIGELWEPFCKLCFEYPINDVTLYEPPLFADVKKKQIEEFSLTIKELPLDANVKKNILEKYNRLWSIITSGEIDLTSDLHFAYQGTRYVVDFKSGFGSNEKGNTNRLLMVGEVYQILQSNYKCLIFVRSNENNHYLQTLQNSGIWDTSTGSNTYRKIQEFTGYDIEKWINSNIDWLHDLEPAMVAHIERNKLGKYLIW